MKTAFKVVFRDAQGIVRPAVVRNVLTYDPSFSGFYDNEICPFFVHLKEEDTRFTWQQETKCKGEIWEVEVGTIEPIDRFPAPDSRSLSLNEITIRDSVRMWEIFRADPRSGITANRGSYITPRFRFVRRLDIWESTC